MGGRATDENLIQKALADLESGKIKSIRAAANTYKVPRSTLGDRIKGKKNYRLAHTREQRLTPTEEHLLVNWILDLDSQGRSPSVPRTEDMAANILRQNGDNRPLGKNWVKKFRTRHPEIATCIGKKIDSQKILGTQSPDINTFSRQGITKTPDAEVF